MTHWTYRDPFYGVTYDTLLDTIDEMDAEYQVRDTARWPLPAYINAEPYTDSEIRCARIARCIVATWETVERNWHGSNVPLNITGNVRLTAKVFHIMIQGFARNADDRKELFRRLRMLRTEKPKR